MDGLNKAIKLFGTQIRLAESIGVEPMAVTHWKKRGIPIKRAIDIEKATDGEVTRADLRPDIFA